MNGRVDGLKAGVELEMPGSANGNDEKIVGAIKSGELDESVLDNAIKRILQMTFKAEETLSNDVVYDPIAHHALARRVAGEGAVLLKNEAGILPLAENCKVALLGRFAKEPRYQGAGSSLMNPTQVDNLYDELAKLIGEKNLSYAPGYDAQGDLADDALIAEAVENAKSADVVVVCVGLTDMYEVEGLDRERMNLPPGHDALIEAITAVYDNVVIALSNGSPVAMPWLADVTAVLEGYLGGQAGAGALADILVGKVNPSGKLAETFPIKLEDNPSHHYFPSGPATVEYRESIYVGYRYYDAVQQEVLFPFGFGLSYTTFEYSDLQLSQDKISELDTLTVSFKVKNTGYVAGQEIVQLYVHDVEASTFRPEKELKGFEKVELEAGEETAVTIQLNRRAFAFYNTVISDWTVEAGAFDLRVGASAQDIRLHAQVLVEAYKTTISDTPAVYKNFPKGTPVSQQDFESLLGHPVPVNKGNTKGNFTINTPFEDLNDTFIGRQLNNFMHKQMGKMIEGQEGTPTAKLMEAMGREAPLRSMLMMGDGSVTREMLEALVVLLNGKTMSGAGALLKAIRNK